MSDDVQRGRDLHAMGLRPTHGDSLETVNAYNWADAMDAKHKTPQAAGSFGSSVNTGSSAAPNLGGLIVVALVVLAPLPVVGPAGYVAYDVWLKVSRAWGWHTLFSILMAVLAFSVVLMATVTTYARINWKFWAGLGAIAGGIVGFGLAKQTWRLDEVWSATVAIAGAAIGAGWFGGISVICANILGMRDPRRLMPVMILAACFLPYGVATLFDLALAQKGVAYTLLTIPLLAAVVIAAEWARRPSQLLIVALGLASIVVPLFLLGGPFRYHTGVGAWTILGLGVCLLIPAPGRMGSPKDWGIVAGNLVCVAGYVALGPLWMPKFAEAPHSVILSYSAIGIVVATIGIVSSRYLAPRAQAASAAVIVLGLATLALEALVLVSLSELFIPSLRGASLADEGSPSRLLFFSLALALTALWLAITVPPLFRGSGVEKASA